MFVNFFSPRTGRVFEVDWTPPGGGDPIVLRPPHVVAANDADTFLALVPVGLGIGQGPLSPAVRERIRRRELRLLLPGWRPEPLPIQVLYPPTRVLPARVRAWVDWLVTLYAEEEAEAEPVPGGGGTTASTPPMSPGGPGRQKGKHLFWSPP